MSYARSFLISFSSSTLLRSREVTECGQPQERSMHRALSSFGWHDVDDDAALKTWLRSREVIECGQLKNGQCGELRRLLAVMMMMMQLFNGLRWYIVVDGFLISQAKVILHSS